MSKKELAQKAWSLVSDTSRVCKPLLWLRDTDSCLPMAPELLPSLRQALHTMIELPEAVEALCEKMLSTYDRAIKKTWVGVGAQPRSSRLGNRTKEVGLIRALDYAESKREEFKADADLVKKEWHKSKDWSLLFSLTKKFIDCLDWGEFVIENARGEASNLVLESVELLEAIEKNKSEQAVREEIGDVFYNLMACCLSLRIDANDIMR